MAMTPKKQGGPTSKPKPKPVVKPAKPAPKSTRRTIPADNVSYLRTSTRQKGM
jgi:hypothetical protein